MNPQEILHGLLSYYMVRERTVLQKIQFTKTNKHQGKESFDLSLALFNLSHAFKQDQVLRWFQQKQLSDQEALPGVNHMDFHLQLPMLLEVQPQQSETDKRCQCLSVAWMQSPAPHHRPTITMDTRL